MSKFDINGSIVEFDLRMDNYNAIRKEFKVDAINKSKDFEEYSIENFKNFKQISDNCLKLGLDKIEESLKKGVETLVSYDVITVDLETFRETYCKKYLNYERIFNNISKETLNNHKQKKQNLVKFFEVGPIIKVLKESLYSDIFNIHLAITDALRDNSVYRVESNVTEESIKKANALFNNYKDGFLSTPDEYKVIEQIIKFNPYRKDIYEFFIKEDGDFNKEIERLTSFLGIDISGYKESLMDEYIDKLLINKSVDLELDKERVKKYAMYIGCSEVARYIARVDAIYMFKNA